MHISPGIFTKEMDFSRMPDFKYIVIYKDERPDYERFKPIVMDWFVHQDRFCVFLTDTDRSDKSEPYLLQKLVATKIQIMTVNAQIIPENCRVIVDSIFDPSHLRVVGFEVKKKPVFSEYFLSPVI